MSPYYALLRLGLRTLGRLSYGIDLGWRAGFDSGRVLDHVYRNEARGTTPLGRLIDRAYLDAPGWKGARARREILIRQLRDAIGRYGAATVLDTAAGQASYLFAIAPGTATYWACDSSADEVAAGEARARRAGRADIRFARADAFDHRGWPVASADVLVTSGFFDILTEPEQFRRVIAAGSAITRPGARWVFTMMEAHDDLALMREVLVTRERRPWVAVVRPAEEIVEWARAAGWEPERLEREPQRFYAIASLVRAR